MRIPLSLPLLLAFCLVAVLIAASLAFAGPGEPRLMQGTLEWPTTLSGESFIVVRADDGRLYYVDISSAQRRMPGAITGGARVAVLGIEGAKVQEVTALAIGAGDATALARAITSGAANVRPDENAAIVAPAPAATPPVAVASGTPVVSRTPEAAAAAPSPAPASAPAPPSTQAVASSPPAAPVPGAPSAPAAASGSAATSILTAASAPAPAVVPTPAAASAASAPAPVPAQVPAPFPATTSGSVPAATPAAESVAPKIVSMAEAAPTAAITPPVGAKASVAHPAAATPDATVAATPSTAPAAIMAASTPSPSGVSEGRRWVEVRGIVQSVTGRTLVLRGEDGNLFAVDVSGLNADVAGRIKPGTTVAVFGDPLETRVRARGVMHREEPEPSEKPRAVDLTRTPSR
jgi:hypothetical protein